MTCMTECTAINGGCNVDVCFSSTRPDTSYRHPVSPPYHRCTNQTNQWPSIVPAEEDANDGSDTAARAAVHSVIDGFNTPPQRPIFNVIRGYDVIHSQ